MRANKVIFEQLDCGIFLEKRSTLTVFIGFTGFVEF